METERDLQQVNFRVGNRLHRMARRLARSRGESLASLLSGLVEAHVKEELGIAPEVEGDELELALVESEIDQRRAESEGRIAHLIAEQDFLRSTVLDT